MSHSKIGVEDHAGRLDIPRAQVTTTALGVRGKPEGRPIPQRSVSLEGFKKYLQRAAVINYQPDLAHTTYEKLKIVLAENNILVYDDGAVNDWMLKMVLKQARRLKWVWKSLTEPLEKLASNVPSLRGISYQHSRYESKIEDYLGTVDFKSRYSKIIPEAVLTTAETILKHFEKTDPICLLVSDYEVAQPDPFLAAAVPGLPFLIVDFWDEPGFQPKAADLDSQKNLNQ